MNKIVNNVLYIPLFTEYAIFLVTKSRHTVVLVDYNSEHKEPIKITKENLDESVKIVEDYLTRKISGPMFFQKIELPPFSVRCGSYEKTLINSPGNIYSDLYFGE